MNSMVSSSGPGKSAFCRQDSGSACSPFLECCTEPTGTVRYYFKNTQQGNPGSGHEVSRRSVAQQPKHKRSSHSCVVDNARLHCDC